MEDIFAIDDAEVEVITRPARAPSVERAILAEYDPVPDSSRQAAEHEDDEYRFDYMPARTPRDVTTEVAPAFDLGLDEEVVVQKQRATAVKLDETLLFSPLGLPRLRDDLLPRLLKRTRGRGHELADLDRIIEGYQFWAHELYPKAKFRDVIKIVSKVGKTRSMKSRRREFINEMIKKDRPEEEAVPEEFELSDLSDEEDLYAPAAPSVQSAPVAPLQSTKSTAQPVREDIPGDDELDEMDDMDALEAMGVY